MLEDLADDDLSRTIGAYAARVVLAWDQLSARERPDHFVTTEEMIVRLARELGQPANHAEFLAATRIPPGDTMLQALARVLCTDAAWLRTGKTTPTCPPTLIQCPSDKSREP